VRDGDKFDLDLGTANSIVHRPALRDRGDVIGAYAIANLDGGHRELEWMDDEDLKAIEKVATSRGKSPAWDGWQDQMQRKSVIRRLCKRLPLGADYFVALALEQAHDEGRDQKDVLDVETGGEASRAEDAAAKAPKVTPPADGFDETDVLPEDLRG
jgi:recombination protein RecT